MSPQSILLIVLVLVLILILSSASGDASARLQPRESANVAAATEPLPAHPIPPDPQPDIAPEDWDVLFSAITDRLRNAVDQRLAAAPEPQARDAVGRLQVIVLECVGALDQLHAALANERSRQRQVEPEMGAPPVTG